MNTSSTTDGQPTVTWVLETKFKELTDEEIKEVITEYEWYSWTLEQFARAILRKASEK